MASTVFNKPVDDEIAALNSKIATQIVNTNITGLTVYKSGNVVSLSYEVNGSGTYSNDDAEVELFVLPVGIRPAVVCIVPLITDTFAGIKATSNYVPSIRVLPNGRCLLGIKKAFSYAKRQFTATYVCTDN